MRRHRGDARGGVRGGGETRGVRRREAETETGGEGRDEREGGGDEEEEEEGTLRGASSDGRNGRACAWFARRDGERAIRSSRRDAFGNRIVTEKMYRHLYVPRARRRLGARVFGPRRRGAATARPASRPRLRLASRRAGLPSSHHTVLSSRHSSPRSSSPPRRPRLFFAPCRAASVPWRWPPSPRSVLGPSPRPRQARANPRGTRSTPPPPPRTSA